MRRTTTTLLLFGLAVLAACQRPVGSSVELGAAARGPDPNTQVYDVGDILAGQDISRSFVFTNRTGQTLKIASPTDIRVGVGVPASRPLSPPSPRAPAPTCS